MKPFHPQHWADLRLKETGITGEQRGIKIVQDCRNADGPIFNTEVITMDPDTSQGQRTQSR